MSKARSPSALYRETWISENFRGKGIDEYFLDRYCERKWGAAASRAAKN